MNHPNAAAAGTAAGAGAGLVAILAVFGIDLPESAALVIVGAAPPVALFVGHRGIKGLARLFWAGEPDVEDSA